MLTTLLLAIAMNNLSPDVSKATIVVNTAKPGIRISPDLYGIFFEEINCSGDGGLYAELVRNRSFEDAEQPAHWSLVERGGGKGEMALSKDETISKVNPTSLKLTHLEGGGVVGASNEGYWGIPLHGGQEYRFSCRAKSDGSPHELRVTLESKDGEVYGKGTYNLSSPYWAEFNTTIRSSKTDPDARLTISIDKPGSVWLDMVSLFPANTFKERTNGFRVDLASKLASLHPSFMRFPGGCWVEGDTMAFSQRWKQTVGDLEHRRTQYNIWKYMSTNGLGYHEYLQLCEDLGAAPMFVINCGMSHKEVVPMAKMDEYVQDALDAIEYANGPVTSKWGAVRAANGHPGSFHLKYLEIGNENGGPAYHERYPLIANAVKAKYPDVKLIANVWGGYPKGTLTEIVDEHYYSSPGFFFENADRYDHYDRKGPKVYVGEYAVTEGCGNGNLIAAVGEAAFMTGMERNSDVVEMCSYAPLFANVNHKTWNPDLICFDNHRSYGTPSYYVQQMFSRDRGDHIVPAQVELSDYAKPTFPGGGVGVGTWGTQAEFKDIKVVSNGQTLLDSPDGSVLSHRSAGWDVVGGALRQTSDGEGTEAALGGVDWSNYTLTLKARKTGGREGFLLSFGMKDPKNWIWWNVGGWGNTEHALERSVNGGKSRLGQSVPGSVETGRWYDLKVEFAPERIRCYLDGKLVHDVTVPTPKPLHIVASRVDKTGEVILKIVNSGSAPIDAELQLEGLTGPVSGTATVLTGNPLDENTLDQPDHVVPVTSHFSAKRPRFSRVFPACSVSVLRVR